MNKLDAILAQVRERGGSLQWRAKGSRTGPTIRATAKKQISASDLRLIAAALADEGAAATDPARRSRLLNRAGQVSLRADRLEEPSAKKLTAAEVDALVAGALEAAGMNNA